MWIWLSRVQIPSATPPFQDQCLCRVSAPSVRHVAFRIESLLTLLPGPSVLDTPKTGSSGKFGFSLPPDAPSRTLDSALNPTAAPARRPSCTPPLSALLLLYRWHGTTSVLVRCTSLVHPLCIWTYNVNVGPLVAGVPPGGMGPSLGYHPENHRFGEREGTEGPRKRMAP